MFEINKDQRTIIGSKENIFPGLAKIGGFFAIVRVVSLISLFHKRRYE